LLKIEKWEEGLKIRCVLVEVETLRNAQIHLFSGSPATSVTISKIQVLAKLTAKGILGSNAAQERK
jgi:hypothetical protein